MRRKCGVDPDYMWIQSGVNVYSIWIQCRFRIDLCFIKYFLIIICFLTQYGQSCFKMNSRYAFKMDSIEIESGFNIWSTLNSYSIYIESILNLSWIRVKSILNSRWFHINSMVCLYLINMEASLIIYMDVIESTLNPYWSYIQCIETILNQYWIHLEA